MTANEKTPEDIQKHNVNFTIDQLNTLRYMLKVEAADVKTMKKDTIDLSRMHGFPEGIDTGEIIANITLTYRHLEDASMRLGKAIQAVDGGVSVYDKEKTSEKP